MINNINIVLNFIQKKEIEKVCLEGQEGLSSDNLFRFIMEDSYGPRKVKYFAICNIGKPLLRFVRLHFER